MKRACHLIFCVMIFAICVLASTAHARDLDTCEWNPGSNRSKVSFVDSVKRLNLPAADEAALLAKGDKHHYDAVVTIRWASIDTRSSADDYRFGPVIWNMNFDDGRLCRQVTRSKWAMDREEDAIVYVVNGKAYGWAAACGNLFELEKLGRAYGAREKFDGTFLPVPAAFLENGLLSDSMPASGVGISQAPVGELVSSWIGGGAFFGGGIGGFVGGGGGACCYCNLVTAPVPEPETYFLILAGLALIAGYKKAKR